MTIVPFPALPGDAFAGRALLVTGASGGVGAAVARALGQLGATVILHGRDERKLIPLYDALVADGAPEPAAIPLDFATATTRHFEALAADIATHVGRLDGIVHCAARTARLTPMNAVPVDDWSTLFHVNVAAPLGLTRACLPLLKAADAASVVFTLESHHDTPTAFWGVQSVPGMALLAALRTLAEEAQNASDPRYNAVIPGPIDAPSRRITHPAEARSGLPAPQAVVPAYAWLLHPTSGAARGRVVAAQRS